jgi:hypothetical protein
MTGTLEDIVLKHLQQAPSNEDIRQRYRRQYEAEHGPNSSDESDYKDHDFRAVRDRALISELLDALFEFSGSNAADGDEIENDLDQSLSPKLEVAHRHQMSPPTRCGCPLGTVAIRRLRWASSTRPRWISNQSFSCGFA